MMFIRGFNYPGWFCGGAGFMYPWGWFAIGAVLVIVAVTLIVVLSSKKKRQAPSSDALEALKLRYSKGELSEDDYLKMKELIGK